jgi:hypothetical protein
MIQQVVSMYDISMQRNSTTSGTYNGTIVSLVGIVSLTVQTVDH